MERLTYFNDYLEQTDEEILKSLRRKVRHLEKEYKKKSEELGVLGNELFRCKHDLSRCKKNLNL